MPAARAHLRPDPSPATPLGRMACPGRFPVHRGGPLSKGGQTVAGWAPPRSEPCASTREGGHVSAARRGRGPCHEAAHAARIPVSRRREPGGPARRRDPEGQRVGRSRAGTVLRLPRAKGRKPSVSAAHSPLPGRHRAIRPLPRPVTWGQPLEGDLVPMNRHDVLGRPGSSRRRCAPRAPGVRPEGGRSGEAPAAAHPCRRTCGRQTPAF